MGNTFGKIPSPSTGAMLEAFEVVGPTGKRISLHAETNSIMERRETRLREAGRTDPLSHLASRPAVVAIEAVSRAAILAEWTGARIHILHISSADELRALCLSEHQIASTELSNVAILERAAEIFRTSFSPAFADLDMPV